MAQTHSEPISWQQAPSSVYSSFVAISQNLRYAGHCIDLHPEFNLEVDFERLDGRYLDAIIEAQGIWPHLNELDIERHEIDLARPMPDCSADQVKIALQTANEALEEYNKLFQQFTATMNTLGAWLGPLPLCRESVQSATVVTDDLTEQAALAITLVPRHRAFLMEFTEQLVGRPLPIRLDGSIVASPTVLERMETGELHISGPEIDVLTRLAERTRTSCQRT